MHALVTSGLHGDLYINMTRLLERPHLLAQACEALLQKVELPKGPLRFVGSAMGSITIAHECARIHGGMMAYTEKEDFAMRLARFTLEKGEPVVLVEDVLNVGSTIRKTIQACAEAQVKLVPTILVIVNTSGIETFDFPGTDFPPAKVVSLFEVSNHKYSPEECLLCKAGSTAKKPKANWSEFAAHNV